MLLPNKQLSRHNSMPRSKPLNTDLNCHRPCQAVWSQAQVVTPEGAALAALIDSLDVGHLWQNDLHVAWFSGLPNYADATSGAGGWGLRGSGGASGVSAVERRLSGWVGGVG